MKCLNSIFERCFIAFLFLCCCFFHIAFAGINKEDFKNPPREYSIAPYWFLNGDLKKDAVIAQMEDMHSKGVHIVIPHARSGLKLEYYLSKDWFDIYEVILVTAKRLGMKVIIYDEYNWPTGNAGNFISRNYPEFTNKSLIINRYEIKGPSRFEVMETKGIIRHFFIAENNKEKVHFVRRDDLIKNNGIFLNIPEGSTLGMLAFVETPKFSVDLMNPKEVEQFISLTHERYYKMFKHYFGDTIIGFCFDEPIISAWPDFPLPWGGSLEKEFSKKHGYSLVDNLPSLFLEVGDFRKVRQDFYSLVSDSFKKSFFCQLASWVKNHGNIFYCGHLMNDDNLYGILQTSGDVFDLFKKIQIPGFDWVGDNRLSPVTGRLISSIAELDRKKMISCEIFGGSGWAFPTRKMKKNVDWAFLLGANMIITHAFSYTVEGNVQLNDYPPSLFTPQPYWEVFKPFADYVKRCSYVLSNSRRISNVALLYPIKNMMQAYTPLEKGKEAESIDRNFEEICVTLSERKLDFKIVSEDLLKKAHILFKSLVINDNKFSVLIIPTLRGLGKETRALIEEMKGKGLNIYVLKKGGGKPEQNINRMIQDIESVLNSGVEGERFFNVSKEVYWFKSQSETNQFFFISNQSETLWGEIEFLLPGVNFNLWDPLKGDVYFVLKAKRLFIPPLSSFFLEKLVTSTPENYNTPPDYLARESDGEIPIQGEWQISREGLNKKIGFSQLQPLGDLEVFSGFSGRVYYKTTFNLSKDILTQNKIYLELEGVRHGARIFLNNRRVGDIFWSPAFLDVTLLLKENNVLELEIYNTFANAISAMHFENNKGYWTKFKKEDLEYGLLNPPKLLLFRK